MYSSGWGIEIIFEEANNLANFMFHNFSPMQTRILEEDKPMASVYMKIFGNEIGFMDYDAILEKFNQWKQSANLMQVRLMSSLPLWDIDISCSTEGVLTLFLPSFLLESSRGSTY